MRFMSLFALCLGLLGCGEPLPKDLSGHKILAMGDSLMAYHAADQAGIADIIEKELGEPVIDRSLVGARFLYPLPISGSLGLRIEMQYRSGDWDWVVINGGGNDLWLGCGCVLCDGQLDRLISKDGRSGAVAEMIARARSEGAKILFIGYLRSPGVGSMIEHCRKYGDQYEARIAKMAQSQDGVFFLNNADLVPYGDRSFHSLDMIHPSRKASEIIGKRAAAIIRRNSTNR